MNIKTIKLAISGMTCDHCASGIEKTFEAKDGIINKNVSYPETNGTFEFDTDKISKEEIIATINSTGSYKVEKEIIQPFVFSRSTIKEDNHTYQYDLVIIGGGSAAFSAAIKANELGKKTLMVNAGLPIGGTCVNVGCVPSKYLIRAADSFYKASHSPFDGINLQKPEIDFSKIIKQKRQLVADLQQKKYLNILDDLPLVSSLKGFATFKNANTVVVDGEKEYTAEKFLIATGSSNYIPDIEGINNVPFLTNESLFELEELPESMIVLGGGYIALEIAQAYQRFGTKVTLVQRSAHILSKQTEDLAEELTTHLKNEGLEIITETKLLKVLQETGAIELQYEQQGTNKAIRAQKLLIAVGTIPNTDKLNTTAINLQLTSKGHIATNEQMQTNIANIYASGDCVDTPAYVYTAAYEGKIAISNAFDDTNLKVNYESLPWVVFTDPQIAGVGMDENEAEKAKIPFETSKIYLKDVPRSIAALDMRGFIKLIRNTETDKLIGARIVAPEGGELTMEIAQAIKHNITTKELGNTLHPYLTLVEGVKLAAISFGKDVSKLSCCAS